MNVPPWFESAMRDVGVREKPGNRGDDIQRYIELAHCGSQGDPWCAIFVNAMLEMNHIHGTRSAAARSFERDKDFIKLPGPALGCIVTFWRRSRGSGLGHVGFYNGERAGYISVLGGNQSDRVGVANYPVMANAFGFSGFYWPKSVRLPATGKIAPYLAPHVKSARVV